MPVKVVLVIGCTVNPEDGLFTGFTTFPFNVGDVVVNTLGDIRLVAACDLSGFTLHTDMDPAVPAGMFRWEWAEMAYPLASAEYTKVGAL